MGIEWLALLVPVVLSLLAFFLYQNKFVWFEVVLPIVISIFIIMICKFFMAQSLISDTEYFSGHIVSAKHYDDWDEWIEETCSSTTCDSKGENCTTTTWDCSYRRYHSEYYEATLNTGSTFGITKEYYKALVKEWKNQDFIDMNRDYYKLDGDAHITNWDGKFNSIKARDWSGTYDNRVQTAETIFHFDDLDSIQKKKVFDYPEIENGIQNSCINCEPYENMTLRKLNGLQGKNKQIKIFIIVFKDKPASIANLQKQYWKGGNKNELVVCVDSKSRWAKSFSWSDDKRLEAQTNQLFMNEHLTLRKKIIELNKLVPKLWKRKQFADFEYINVQLNTTQLIWIFVLTTIFSIGLIIFGITNGLDQDTFDTNNKKNW